MQLGQGQERASGTLRRPLAAVLRYGAPALALAVLALAAGVYLALRASLPRIEGELAAPGLAAPAIILRDAQGTPTIRARSRNDLAYATGFAHAQDRYFQMDLMRRAAAGELAALLGPAALPADKRLRVHAFRRIAAEVVRRLPAQDLALLQAYAAGANAALEAALARPWEYLVLRAPPAPWRVEDSVLVAYSMYLDLNDSAGEQELAREQLYQALPPALFDFLHPLGTEWDAPLQGGRWSAPPVPGPQILDLRHGSAYLAAMHAPRSARSWPEQPVVGSNSWAVAASRAAQGAALLANDMHLGLRLPHVWYRARLIVEPTAPSARNAADLHERASAGTGRDPPPVGPSDAVPDRQAGPEPRRDLVGVTLPGLPMLIAGSNGHVAWGFTNSYGDWTDLVIVEADPANPTRYLTAQGSEPYELRRESIEVAGEQPIDMEVRWTRWGPIVGQDGEGRALALAWTAHEPQATNMRMVELETARDVEDALLAANRAGTPVQNILAVDAAGHIGWSLMGQVPVRAGYDSTRPASWRMPDTGWTRWREPQEYPRIIDPPAGRLWTANARTLDVASWIEFLGDGGYDLGARAGQIRDGLLALQQAQASDMLAIQLDDRALFLERWRGLLLDLLGESQLIGHPARQEARRLIENWSGHAAVDDAGYTIVRAARLRIRQDVFETLTAIARTKFPDTRFTPSAQFEGPLWQLVTQRPQHLLDPRYPHWEAALLDSVDATLAQLAERCGALSACTWGEHNLLSMRHPLSAALPLAARWLDMPAEPLPGDIAMPRVQGPSFGASQRLVVSPGREAEGWLQMPGGPVDHPLSPFYGAGHEAWMRGEPGPLLPGEDRYRLRLIPVQ